MTFELKLYCYICYCVDASHVMGLEQFHVQHVLVKVLLSVTSCWWSHGKIRNVFCVLLSQVHDRTNNVSDHIIERTALPGHLIKGVSGKIVFHAENRQVYMCIISVVVHNSKDCEGSHFSIKKNSARNQPHVTVIITINCCL